jgi:hypothetical protein
MIDVLFGGELVVIAVGWQMWASLVVSVVLFVLALTLVGGWSVGVDWVIGDSIGGNVLLMVVGAVVWLEWGSCVVVAIVGWGPWGRPVEGWLLGVGLSNVAVVRCRMCCVMAVVGGGFIPALSCGAVGWM